MFPEAPILRGRSEGAKRADFLVMDCTGNVDVIETKKPFDKSVVTQRTYRDNYIPLRELSGTSSKPVLTQIASTEGSMELAICIRTGLLRF